MASLFTKTKFYVYLLGTFLLLPFLFGGISHAVDDLLWDIFKVTKENDTMLNLGENVNTVGGKIIRGTTDTSGGGSPITVKMTRLLLMLTIVLSVTMILYNGMIYIIETGQGKEGKSLIKNVILIVVGILVSIFSVVIINLIQSVPTTLDKEINSTNFKENNEHKILNAKKIPMGTEKKQ